MKSNLSRMTQVVVYQVIQLALVQTRIDRFTAQAQIDTLQFDCDELQIQGSSLDSGIIHQWVWGNGSTSSDSSATTFMGWEPIPPCILAPIPHCLVEDLIRFYQFMVRPKIEASFNIEPVCDKRRFNQH